MMVWPWDLFPPVTEGWQLAGVAASGGVTVAGLSRLNRTDGGGIWTCRSAGIDLTTRQQIKAARALDALLDGGVTSIEVPAFEYPFQPRLAEADAPLFVPHSDGSGFSDGSLYEGRTMEVVLAQAADLRATTLRVLPILLGDLEGGEKFTIAHPTRGARKYVIGKVMPVEGGAIDITIRPPLREAAPEGTDLDFDKPRCVMRLANPDWLGPLDALHEMTADPVWVEAF